MESDPHVDPERPSGETENPDAGTQPRPLAPEKATELLRAVAPAALKEDEEEAAASAHVSTVLGPLPAVATPQQTRDLNDAVHQILIIGLSISTVLLVAGLIIELLRQGALPEATLHPVEAIQRTLQFRASGFLSLGLLVLMITPIVRVIGSIIVFIWERDRRYTLITLTVLVVMLASVLFGRG